MDARLEQNDMCSRKKKFVLFSGVNMFSRAAAWIILRKFNSTDEERRMGQEQERKDREYANGCKNLCFEL